MNRFYKNGRLSDTEIAIALSDAVNEYENGEVIEVRDKLAEIVSAIDLYIKEQDERDGSE